MAEESESEPPPGPTDDESPETASESDDRPSTAGDASDAAADDGETDAADSSDDVPGGSIEDYLDDESIIETDERAPMGATGTPDPFDEDERRSVSDAVGAPVPESELEDDPELELDPSVAASDGAPDADADDTPGSDSASRSGQEMRGSTTPRHWQNEDADATDDDSVVQTTADSVVETDDEPAETPTEPSVDAEFDADAEPATDLTAAGEESTDVLDDGLVGEGPASDEEMPLAAHIEEMVRRLAVVLVVGGVVALAVFPIADQLINFLWNSHIPGAETITDRRPRLYGPLELVVTELKVAALAGFVVGLPIAVYETYLFMRPGLFPRERRYYLAAVPTSLILALIGVAFAHFVVLPAIFAYFTAYTTGTAVVAFGLKETFSLILVLMGYMALVFQIPLFIMLAIMMNLTTRVWLEDRRLLFWGGFLGVAFLISPDPTGMAPIIVAATMIALFEGTLALLRWTGN
ncbi:twin-arginine translocase subunit TatC [Haloplanus natans]|uniref:twin-arginine translocase subunit TatC n=1 Tax=Haloplanus natans TaxID=376171 RepID=UPI000677EF86|nr:twin-arginine translocase subunit TatC [Haloplanus natans]